ncbi:MAG: zinc-ribbon domain-containing protein [Myxococcota bacterium]
MVVECERCSTRFQLDESKVPAKGIRVRCSSCKYSFLLRRPSASPEEAVGEVVAETAASPKAPTPEATQDLGADTPQSDADDRDEVEVDVEVEEESEEEEHADEEDLEDGEDEGVGDDDSDWEFNHEDADPAEREQVEAASESDFDERDASSPSAPNDPYGGNLTAGFIGGQEPSADSADASEFDAGDVFGSMDDFARAPETDVKDSRPPMEIGGWEDAGSRAGSSDHGDEDGAAPEIGGASGAAGRVGDARPPEEPRARVTPDKASTRGPLGRIAPTAKQSQQADAAQPSESARASEAPPWLKRGGELVGWTLTAGLLVVGIIRGVMPADSAMSAGPETVVVEGGLEARRVEGHWVETLGSGTLFSITGELHNPGTTPVTPDQRIEVVLLDAEGDLLTHADSPIGLPLPEATVRELPRAERIRSSEFAARALAEFSIAAGDSVRFQALVEAVPDRAERFQLKATGLSTEASPTGDSPGAILP